MNIFYIQLAGLILGFTGTLILAVFLGRVLKMLVTAIKAHETSTDSLTGKNDGIVFTGFDKQLEKAMITDKRISFFGLWLLVASFSLQIISLCIIK